jgi:hypothetical protein
LAGKAGMVVRTIVHHRTKKRLGPVQIAALVGVAPSTVHRVLTRCGLQRLAWLDRATGTPIRYEYPDPGGLVHVDVKKLGVIPAGGGWRKLGRDQGGRNSNADKSSGRFSRHRNPLHGHGFIHVAVDPPMRDISDASMTAETRYRLLLGEVACPTFTPDPTGHA